MRSATIDTMTTPSTRHTVPQVCGAVLSQQPTEAQYIKLATGMYTNTSLPKEDRLLALEELKELVRPVDNADDLHALGALAPLIHVAIDAPGEEDEDIAAAAASETNFESASAAIDADSVDSTPSSAATAPITVPGSMSTAPSGRIWLRTGLGRVYEDALRAPSKPSLKCNIFQRHPVRGTTLEAKQDRTRILPTVASYLVLCGSKRSLTGRRVVHENAASRLYLCACTKIPNLRLPPFLLKL